MSALSTSHALTFQMTKKPKVMTPECSQQPNQQQVSPDVDSLEDFPMLSPCSSESNLRKAKRIRRKPKVFTPNFSSNKVYCFCQKENTSWYLICSMEGPNCLVYYHPECVGLEWMKTEKEGKKYSNCSDGFSYACPMCTVMSDNVALEVSRGNEKKQKAVVIGQRCSGEAGANKVCMQSDEGMSRKKEEDVKQERDDTLPEQYSDYEMPDRESDECSIDAVQSNGLPDECQGTDYEESLEGAPSKISVGTSVQGSNGLYTSCDDDQSNGQSKECKETDYDESSDVEQRRKSVGMTHETLQRMMDTKKLTQKSYFLHEIPTYAHFQIPEIDWTNLQPKGVGGSSLDPSWTDMFTKYMAQSNCFCTFHFDWHFIQKSGSRKKNNKCVFTAKGKCVFSDCPVKFTIQLQKQDEVTRVFKVTYTGSVKHANGERHARFLKNKERDSIRNLFKETNVKPSRLHQERKNDLHSDSKASGNRTGCGVHPETMRKIASEARLSGQMDSDMVKSLENILKDISEKDASREIPPRVLDGFIHIWLVHTP